MSITKEAKREYDAKRYPEHREENIARVQRHHQEHPEVRRAWDEKNRYGNPEHQAYKRSAYAALTPEARARYHNNQTAKRLGVPLDLIVVERAKDVCDICGRPERAKRAGKVLKLCIDHDHQTGVVRGTLCLDCNFALGKAGDSPERLRAMADYLERTQP